MKMTPSELLFQSFRHSQGSISPQLHIFRYMDIAHGISVDLHPTGQELERYVAYARGATRNTKNHLDLADDENKLGGIVIGSIKAIRRVHGSSYGTKVRRRGLEDTITYLASDLLQTEMRILGKNRPWSSYRNNEPRDRPVRLKTRVEAGKSSYIYLHGRDGQTTGREEFDAMYAALWQETEKPRFDVMRRDHALAVIDAEQSVLGATALGRLEDTQGAF